MKSFKQDIDEMKQLVEFLEEDIDNIQRVIEFCERKDLDVDFEVHAKAETCEESAEHSPVSIDQITKTLVFIAGEEPVAVLCPGNRSVSEEKLEEALDGEVRMADPEEVEEATGYPIGAVSPFDLEIETIMEEKLLEKDEIRPAAGSRAVGADLDPEKLAEAIGATVEDVSR